MTEFGPVRRDGELGAVRFERVYGVPPEELWDAWTVPERIKRWLGASVTGGPIGRGASFVLDWGPDEESKTWVAGLEPAPPRRREWRWSGGGARPGEKPSTLRVSLDPVPGGTRLVLDHSGLSFTQFAGLSSGWHDFLDVLGSGVPSDEERWRELLPEYRSRVAAL